VNFSVIREENKKKKKKKTQLLSCLGRDSKYNSMALHRYPVYINTVAIQIAFDIYEIVSVYVREDTRRIMLDKKDFRFACGSALV
jgi:hypothetical protein